MPTLQRMRMSYDEWLALPSKPKAEWVDGEVVVSPPAVWRHSLVQGSLVILLGTALPELYVATEAAVRLPRNRVRIPDVAVVDRRPAGTMITEAPVLVAEVLSPSTRSEDTIRKSAEYAAGEVGQYWIVDPELRTLDVHALVGGAREPALHLDADHPTGQVSVGDHGVVAIDLAALFR